MNNVIVILGVLLTVIIIVALIRDGEYERFEENNKKVSEDKSDESKQDKII